MSHKPYRISNEHLANALDTGLSQSEIARMCGCSRQAIHSRINYKPKHKKHTSEIIHILSKLGFRPKQIYEIIKKLRKGGE